MPQHSSDTAYVSIRKLQQPQQLREAATAAALVIRCRADILPLARRRERVQPQQPQQPYKSTKKARARREVARRAEARRAEARMAEARFDLEGAGEKGRGEAV